MYRGSTLAGLAVCALLLAGCTATEGAPEASQDELVEMVHSHLTSHEYVQYGIAGFDGRTSSQDHGQVILGHGAVGHDLTVFGVCRGGAGEAQVMLNDRGPFALRCAPGDRAAVEQLAVDVRPVENSLRVEFANVPADTVIAVGAGFR